MSGNDKTDDQSGIYNIPAETAPRGSDVAPLSAHASTMSAPTAWIERLRLDQIAKTQAQHKIVIEQAVEINLSIGDLAESELYKATAIDALHDRDNHVIRERGRRKKEEDIADIRQDTELTKAQRKLKKQKQKLADLNKEKTLEEGPADAKSEASQIILNARISDLKKHIDAEIAHSKEAGYYSEAYEENLHDDLGEQIEKLRKQYLS